MLKVERGGNSVLASLHNASALHHRAENCLLDVVCHEKEFSLVSGSFVSNSGIKAAHHRVIFSHDAIGRMKQ